jgi:transcriptional regulator with XRE-family HTH domain
MTMSGLSGSRTAADTSLASFMRRHRAKISPESAGRPTPKGRGRRAAGLSQPDLAILVDVAPATLQRLESGRMSQPDEGLLDRIAVVLRLNEPERVELYRRALGRDPGPSYMEHPASRLTPFWRNVINNQPLRHWVEANHPVHGPITYAVSLDWIPLAGNSAFDAMFLSRKRPANMFHWIALDGRDQLLDHKESWLRLLLPQLRGLRLKYPDHPGLWKLEKWCETEPAVREMWESSTLSYIVPDGALRKFFHADYGPGTIELGVEAPSRSEDRDLRHFTMHMHEGVTPREVRIGRESLPDWH